MKTVTIVLTGADPSDIELALQRAQVLIAEGYSSGFDRHDTGSFVFESKGDWDYDEQEGND